MIILDALIKIFAVIGILEVILVLIGIGVILYE